MVDMMRGLVMLRKRDDIALYTAIMSLACCRCLWVGIESVGTMHAEHPYVQNGSDLIQRFSMEWGRLEALDGLQGARRDLRSSLVSGYAGQALGIILQAFRQTSDQAALQTWFLERIVECEHRLSGHDVGPL